MRKDIFWRLLFWWALCSILIFFLGFSSQEADCTVGAAVQFKEQKADPFKPQTGNAVVFSLGPVDLARYESQEECRMEKILESVPLDARTQDRILTVCREDKHLFCMIMAIASVESRFDGFQIGDNGGSFGIFQINRRWHRDRMRRLGVDDLTDPVQCAVVAVDIIDELTGKYGYCLKSHALIMAYNMGPTGEKRAMEKGYASTDYSLKLMERYEAYWHEAA